MHPARPQGFSDSTVRPFWPNINDARPVVQRPREVILFASLILGYVTLAAVTAAVIRQETEAVKGAEEQPVRRAGW